MKDSLESKLHSLQDNLVLSEAEKDFHRTQLEETMRMRPSMQPVPSPFISILFGRPQMAFAMLALAVLGSGGVVVASDRAVPGDALYAIKLEVAEPARLALTFDAKERAELEVTFADRRLKEFAVASLRNTLDEETADDITESLTERIAGAQEEIKQLKNEGESEDAYLAHADLRTMLLTHTNVLQKVSDANPNAVSSVAEVQSKLSVSLTDLAGEENELETLVAGSPEDTDLVESVEESRIETSTALAGLQAQVAESEARLDSGDQTVIVESMAKVDQLIRDAHARKEEGEDKAALQLYAAAEEEIDELSVLIESERVLEIDLIEPSAQ